MFMVSRFFTDPIFFHPEFEAGSEIQLEFQIMLDPVVWSTAYIILKGIKKTNPTQYLIKYLKEVDHEQNQKN